MGDAEALVITGNDPDRDGQEGSKGEAQVDTVDEGAVAVLAVTGTESLRNEGVQTDEEAFAKEGEDDEDAGTDADGTDGFGTVGETANHHGIDDYHAHPADFREDERKGEMKGGAEFVAEDAEEGHGNLRRYQISGGEEGGQGFEGGVGDFHWGARKMVIFACAEKGVERRVGVCHWACLPA